MVVTPRWPPAQSAPLGWEILERDKGIPGNRSFFLCWFHLMLNCVYLPKSHSQNNGPFHPNSLGNGESPLHA